MQKQECLKIFENCFYQCNNEDLKIFMNYISGSTEISPEKVRFSRYSLYQNIWEEAIEDNECKEVVKRAFQTLIKIDKTLFSNSFYQTQNRYGIFSALELSNDFMAFDFINRHFTMTRYMQNYFQEQLKNFNLNCPGTFEEWADNIHEYKDVKLLAALVGLAFLAGQKGVYIKKFEQIYISILKNYSSDCELEEALRVISGRKNKFVNENDVIQICINNNLKKDLLFNISHLGYGCSEAVNCAVHAYFVIESPQFLFTKMEGGKFPADYFKEKNMPYIVYLKYYSWLLSRIYGGNDRNESIEIIENIYSEDNAVFYTVIDFLLQKKQIYAGTLVAFLCSKKQEKAFNYINEIEEQLRQNFYKCYILEKNNLEIEQGMEENCFSCLNDKNFMSDSISGDWIDYSGDSYTAAMVSAYLMGYSVVAANIVKIAVRTLNYELNYMNLFESVQVFFECKGKTIYDVLLEDINISLKEIVKAKLQWMNWVGKSNDSDFLDFLKNHKQESESGFDTFQLETAEWHIYIQLLFGEENGFDVMALEKVFYKKSKVIASDAEKLLKTRESVSRHFVENMINSKSKMAADAALRLIRYWDNDKIEKELNKIDNVESLVNYIEKLYTKGNDKNLPYYDVIKYDAVRKGTSDERLPAVLIKYYISEYMMLKDLYFVKTCEKILSFSNLYDIRHLIKQIFDMWVSEGSSVKYKNILFPFALTAGETQIADLKRQIDFWADNSKLAVAAFAVQTLAYNGGKMALMTVDMLSQKHKSKKVKLAAKKALEDVAENLNISMDELYDMIVPDMGFNRNRQRIFNYGKRKFICKLNEKQETILTDESGKIIKSLPKASAKYEDNEDYVKAAKDDYKTMKKQLKSIVDAQKPRMFNAMVNERTWPATTWKSLFLENPILFPFATGLIWKTKDKKDNLVQTFRYLEDGTLNTLNEEEYVLNDDDLVSLLHTSDISKEQISEWSQQLEDYEILQPIPQLAMPVYELQEQEKQITEWDYYKGIHIYGAGFKSIASKYGFSLYFKEYGDCSGCIYKDEKTDMTAVISCTPFYPGEYNAAVEIQNIYFYKNNNNVMLGKVPKKLLSIVMFVGNALKEKNISK